MAQAVYCTFCTAFPTSYKQFGDEFKENLIQIIHEWIAGKSFVHVLPTGCIEKNLREYWRTRTLKVMGPWAKGFVIS